MNVKLERSNRKHKKWKVSFDNNTTVHFGDDRFEDYTIHKDKHRKKRFLDRFAQQDENDYTKPYFWSRWLLWNKSTLEKSIDDIRKRMGIKVHRD